MSENKSIDPSSRIAGVLRDPIVRKLPDGINTIYHWETADKKHTFVYLTITKNPDNQYYDARTNIDSEDVKGQGDALWQFLGEKIQQYSNQGINGQPISIRHEVKPNDYAKRLPESDPRYQKSPDDPKVFYGLYTPKAK